MSLTNSWHVGGSCVKRYKMASIVLKKCLSEDGSFDLVVAGLNGGS